MRRFGSTLRIRGPGVLALSALVVAAAVSACARSGFVGAGDARADVASTGGRDGADAARDDTSVISPDSSAAADAAADVVAFTCGSSLSDAPGTVAGRVFEDTDYAGGPGSASSGEDVGFADVRVEAYDSAGAMLAYAMTDAAGRYRLSGLGRGTYRVRVVSATIGDANTPPAAGYNDGASVAVPEQTYECNGRYANGQAGALGGNDPQVDDRDTAAGAGPGDTSVAVVLTGGGVGGVDFGFSFDLISNTKDAGQGSLRQFLSNAEAIRGANASMFQIPDGATLGMAADPQVIDGVAEIRLRSALPALTDVQTRLDATTQPSDAAFPLRIVESLASPVLPAGTHALIVRCALCELAGFEIRNFRSEGAYGIFLESAESAVVRDNLLINCGHTGPNGTAIALLGSQRCVIRNNSIRSSPRDAIRLWGEPSDDQIRNNVIEAFGDDGISQVSGSGVLISGNLVSDGDTNGIELVGATQATVRGNRISGVLETGIMVGAATRNVWIETNEIRSCGHDAVALINSSTIRAVRISKNATSGNRELSIDLWSSDSNVAPNDPGDIDEGPNGLMNYPVLSRATLTGSTLVMEGECRAGARVELFQATPNLFGHGETSTYLGAGLENCAGGCDDAVADELSGAGTEDSTAKAFRFTLEVETLAPGDSVTATATDPDGNTSEVSRNIVVSEPGG
jgi:hypothetical protein